MRVFRFISVRTTSMNVSLAAQREETIVGLSRRNDTAILRAADKLLRRRRDSKTTRGTQSFRLAGFTLLELMAALTVLGVLLAVGVPSFVALTQNNRVTSQTNQLVSALNLARSEAIRRGGQATVQAIDAALGFAGGWCVHVGSSCADSDDVLRTYPAMTRLNVASDATFITFDARGARQLPTAAQLRITLAPDDCASGTARARRLDIALTGRISVERIGCP